MIYILILTYNRPDDVAEFFATLEPSICRDDVEVHVLDNGSDEKTKDLLINFSLLARHDGIIVYNEPENLGVAAGRQRLLDEIDPRDDDIVIFMDSDCVIEDNNWIDRLIAYLEPENIGICGPAGSFVSPDWTGFIPAPPNSQCDVVSGFLQAFKAELLNYGLALDLEYGKFYEEDSDFCLQIADLGWDCWNTPGVGVFHTSHESGKEFSNRAFTMMRFHEKWVGRGLIAFEGAY